jgi:predicted methyltransferase
MSHRSLAFWCLLLVGCAHPPPPAGPPEPAPTPVTNAAVGYDPVQTAVAQPDRTEADRALDAGRHPGQVLSFFGVLPAMQVADIGAGGGYTTELLTRIVGTDGKVYGQNAPFMLERFAEKPWSERLARPVNAAVVRLDTPYDAPFPADFPSRGQLQVVVHVLGYHDTVWQNVDRAAMNAAIFAALAPGGVYGIVDHSARPEDGLTVTETLHRIDERAVITEVTAAGFVLEASGDFLRNPGDARDWNASPMTAAERRGTSDRFVLRFVKPAPPAGG